MNSSSQLPKFELRDQIKPGNGTLIGRLIAIDNQDDIELRDGFILVGRHPSCEVTLDSARISRIHCCIYTSNDRVFVRDLNSTNGIRVNGKLLLNSELCHNDTLSIASMRYYCELKSQNCSESKNDIILVPKPSSVKMWQKPPDIQPVVIEESEIQKMELFVKKLIHQEGVPNCRVEIHVHWDSPDNRNLTTES